MSCEHFFAHGDRDSESAGDTLRIVDAGGCRMIALHYFLNAKA